MTQKTFDFDPAKCTLRSKGADIGECPCFKSADCPHPPCFCEVCGCEIEGTPYRRRVPGDHTETEEVCITCYQK